METIRVHPFFSEPTKELDGNKGPVGSPGDIGHNGFQGQPSGPIGEVGCCCSGAEGTTGAECMDFNTVEGQNQNEDYSERLELDCEAMKINSFCAKQDCIRKNLDLLRSLYVGRQDFDFGTADQVTEYKKEITTQMIKHVKALGVY